MRVTVGFFYHIYIKKLTFLHKMVRVKQYYLCLKMWFVVYRCSNDFNALRYEFDIATSVSDVKC